MSRVGRTKTAVGGTGLSAALLALLALLALCQGYPVPAAIIVVVLVIGPEVVQPSWRCTWTVATSTTSA